MRAPGILVAGFVVGMLSVGVVIGAFNMAEARLGRQGATIAFMLGGGIAFALLLGAAHMLADREAR